MLFNEAKVILDLCGGTRSWSQPYAEAGYDVQVIDSKSGQDVCLAEMIKPVYGVLAAPPCTVFASSGARLERSEADMLQGLSVVDACMRIILVTQPHFWSLENPVGTLRRWLGSPRMYFQPNHYGDRYTKRTCLWGRFNIPKLHEVEAVEGSKMHLNYGGKSERTKTARSITPPGFARAFFEANP